MSSSEQPDPAQIDPSLIDISRPAAAPEAQGLGADLVMALRFFSRLPTGSSPHRPPELARVAMALPLASFAIGIAPAVLLVVATMAGAPPLVAAVLAVALAVMVGGGMGEDALADAADGLWGGTTPERRLAIMKDSRHGTYGVCAICLTLLLRVTVLGSIAEAWPVAAAGVWLAATLLGRSGALWLAVVLPQARVDGASASVGRLPLLNFAIGAALALLLFVLLAAPATSLFACLVALLVAIALVAVWMLLCRQLVGGQTGDLIGALGTLLELLLLLVLMPFI